MKNNEFNPGVRQFFLNHNYHERRQIFHYLQGYSGLMGLNGLDLLEISSGTNPYSSVFKNFNHITLEHEGSKDKANFYFDGCIIPFDDNSYDNIVSILGLYHSNCIGNMFLEMNRILKKDGSILLILPFLYPQYNSQSINLRFSLNYTLTLLESSGFKLVSFNKLNPGFKTPLNILNTMICDFLVAHQKGSFISFFFIGLRILTCIVFNCLMYIPFPTNSNSVYYSSILYAKKI